MDKPPSGRQINTYEFQQAMRQEFRNFISEVSDQPSSIFSMGDMLFIHRVLTKLDEYETFDEKDIETMDRLRLKY